MSKLCLGTFLTSIKVCANKRVFVQGRDFREMFSSLKYDYLPKDDMIVHMVGGRRNPSNSFIDTIKKYEPSQYLEIGDCLENIVRCIDPNKKEILVRIICKIIQDDDSIENEDVVDLINNTKKSKLPGNFGSLSCFLAGVFMFVIYNTDNTNCHEYVKEINDEFVARVSSEIQKNPTKDTKQDLVRNPDFWNRKANKKQELNSDIDEAEQIRARQFIIDHEEEKNLVPLCQVAFLYHPNHKHVRPMYTEYCLLSSNVRRYVLQLCDSHEMIDVSSLYVERNINLFCDDLRKYVLSSERYIYMFRQYLFRAFECYSDCVITHYCTELFARLNKSSKHPFMTSDYSSLEQYIYDYMINQEQNTNKKAQPPMDYLVERVNLLSCNEEALTFWLCRFVIDACNNLFCKITTQDISYSIIDDQTAETQEDLFYIALHSLFVLSLCHESD